MSFLFMKLFSKFHRNEGTFFRFWLSTSLITRSSTKAEDSRSGRCCRCLSGVWESTRRGPLRFRRHVKRFLIIPDVQLCHSELDAFGDDFDVMWRGFVTSVIAAVALQYVDPLRLPNSSCSKFVFRSRLCCPR